MVVICGIPWTQHYAKDNCSMSAFTWWRHQLKTFSVLLVLCEGKPPVTAGFPSVTRSVDVFFDLRLNKRLSKQSRCWWFESPSRWLWRHCIVRIALSTLNAPFFNSTGVICEQGVVRMYSYNTNFYPDMLRVQGYCYNLSPSVSPSVLNEPSSFHASALEQLDAQSRCTIGGEWLQSPASDGTPW